MNYENIFKNNNIEIRVISELQSLDIIFRNHYSKIMPRLTKYRLGGFIDGRCIGIMTCGYGTRPLHTIRKLFPSLTTKDYFEIGKMCIEESEPKNTESAFLCKVIKWLKINEPNRKVLFTWADGILKKPGYVYQASNFLAGGYVWTDTYISPDGERVHPRTTGSTNMVKISDSKFSRPSKEYLKNNGWRHYQGKLFRYVYFLCDKKEKKRLLKESTVEWNTDYPKEKDLQWKLQDYDNNKWTLVDDICYNQTVNTALNKKVIENKRKLKRYQEPNEFFG